MGCCASVKNNPDSAFPIISPKDLDRKDSLSNQLDRIIKKKEESSSPNMQFSMEMPRVGNYRDNEVQMKRVSRVKLNTSIMQEKKPEISAFGRNNKSSKRANTMNLGQPQSFLESNTPVEDPEPKNPELKIYNV